MIMRLNSSMAWQSGRNAINSSVSCILSNVPRLILVLVGALVDREFEKIKPQDLAGAGGPPDDES